MGVSYLLATNHWSDLTLPTHDWLELVVRPELFTEIHDIEHDLHVVHVLNIAKQDKITINIKQLVYYPDTFTTDLNR